MRISSAACDPDVRDAPDGAGSVVCDEQAAVFGYGDADRAAPNLAVFRDKACKEIFVTAICLAVVHRYADDFVTCAVLTVP